MFMCHGNASEQKAMTKCQLQGIRETKHSKRHQNPNHPFSFLKLQRFLMSQHPWASYVIPNHTNKPIDLTGVIRRVFQDWPLFRKTRKAPNFLGLAQEYVERLELQQKEQTMPSGAFMKAGADYLLTKGKRDIKAKKKKKKGATGLGG